MAHHIHGQHTNTRSNKRTTQRENETHIKLVTGKRPIPETRKMQVHSTRSGLPRHGYHKRYNQNGPNQISWNKGLAHTRNSQTNTLVFRIWKFLQTIHIRLCTPDTTPSQLNEEKQDMGLDT